ncbi:MAG: hypothetical protein JXA10_08125 [Anaerolineae bacterium]|nr:hypothetical protein [Anaerolineae bacterium]
MSELMDALFNFIWDLAAQVIVAAEENPKLSVNLLILIVFLAIVLRHVIEKAIREALGKGKFIAYENVATKGQIVQTNTGMLVILVTLLAMLVVLLLVFFMLRGA